MRVPFFFLFGIVIMTCGGVPMIGYGQILSKGGGPPLTGLPYEADSDSELLSSTHLFEVEILSLRSTPWSSGADGLERRRLDMDIKLLDTFKGTVNLERNKTFHLEVEQRRESEFVESDYHGLWSHVAPSVGVRYLVISKAKTTSPAELMQEGACQQLLDEKRVADVQLAMEAESLFRETILKNVDKNPQLAAARNLLKFTQERRTLCKDVFARYLWARLKQIFLESEDRPLTEIIGLITAEDATIELRGSLVSDLYDAVLFLDPNPALHQKVVKTFFNLLLQKGASSLHHRLVEVQLYNLIFKDDEAEITLQTVFPDHEERKRVKAVLAHIDSDGARKLLAWLSEKNS